MSSNFGSELTRLGLPPTMDTPSLVAGALARNRRRIRTLSSLTIGLWILTFLLVPALWMPFAAKMKQEAMLLNGAADAYHAAGSVDNLTHLETLNQVLQESLMHIAMVSGFILAVITIASLLAAISTIWLVLTVRRVTLEQLALGLAQISDQLRRLESGNTP